MKCSHVPSRRTDLAGNARCCVGSFVENDRIADHNQENQSSGRNPIVAHDLRMRSLAMGLASALGAAGATTWPAQSVATTRYVQNCFDSGAGSLRDTVAASGNGDTVSLGANLPCSTITLTSGAIKITQPTLYLTGPGADVLSINGAGDFSVLRHYGAGKLAIEGLTIKDGKYTSATVPRGGCVYSKSNVTLVDSTVANCAVEGTDSAEARGGGIYAHGTIGMRNSTITGNVALGAAAGSRGGGIFLNGTIVAIDSVFSDNEAAVGLVAAGLSEGGALWVAGTTYLRGSLVTGNRAEVAAAIGTQPLAADSALGIVNSTVSENVASLKFGGIYSKVPVTLSNSTIAFNVAPAGGAVYSVGQPLKLESSIIADNVTGGLQIDLDGALKPPLTGYNNLITSSTIGFPPGTITSCPKLGPLAANGAGAMKTHALLAGSPALNAGYDPHHLQTDQRGPGFLRTVGVAVDIGAFERQGGTDDRITVHGFEPICDH
jgi:hypothetical protein